MRLILRFVLFFATIFVLLGGLDVWTTELGRHRAGSVELNPMGFMPLSQSIRMEIPFLLLGCMLVAIGAWIRRDTLLLASSVPFDKFFWQFLLKRYFGFLLLLAPLEIALLRSLAVINNAQQLMMGWSVFAYVTSPIKWAFKCSDVVAFLCMFAAISILALVPTSWLIYFLARRGRIKLDPHEVA